MNNIPYIVFVSLNNTGHEPYKTITIMVLIVIIIELIMLFSIIRRNRK